MPDLIQGALISLPVVSRHGIFFWFLRTLVKVRWTFFLVTVLLGLRTRSVEGVLTWIVVAFFAIVLHECGHALAARFYRQSPQIELHAMGGVTKWTWVDELKWSQRVVISVAGIVALSSRPELRGFVIFLILPLLTVAQMAFSGRAQANHALGQETFARAEALAWATGDVSAFNRDQVPSPWFRAHQQLQHGHPDVPRQVLLADFAEAYGDQTERDHAALVEAVRMGALGAIAAKGDRAELLAVAMNSDFKDTAVAAVDGLGDRAELDQIVARGKNKSAVKRARAIVREAEESSIRR